VSGFALAFPMKKDQVAIVGLGLVYSLQITGLLQWTVRTGVETENNMTAVERLEHYANNIPKEEDAVVTKNYCEVPEEWPQNGGIVIKNAFMRYRPELPLVLKGLDLEIKPREKIGIVGRTGSGKSSLIIALFRIVNIEKGSIFVDGKDISTVSLHKLRSKLALIPQDPVLFSGTIRRNLDPFEEHDDDAVWEALRMVEMNAFVETLEGKLNYSVNEGGDNLSAGQRQLLCVGRALLRDAKIIVMDEATASVDSETDSKLQNMIRNQFENRTVLCIAHRLETILDSDRIAVLSDGKLEEYDTPENLMKTDGIFSGLIDEMNNKHL